VSTHRAGTPEDVLDDVLAADAQQGGKLFGRPGRLAGQQLPEPFEVHVDVVVPGDLPGCLLGEREAAVDDFEIQFREVLGRLVDVRRVERFPRNGSQRE